MLTRVARDGEPVYYVSPLLGACGVAHAFSTRLGGVSPPPFDSLNLGNPSGDLQDDWGRIHENYRRLQGAIGRENLPRLWVHQVHAAGVATVRAGDGFESGAKADALAGDDPSRLLAVRVADCVPVLMARADGRLVAAVHAGWRGVVAGVVPAAVEAMRSIAALPARDLRVAIGPAIGPRAFEVGPEVAADFRRRFGGAAGLVHRADSDRWTIDLAAAIVAQLAELGVADAQVDGADLCTFERADEFFSHRRDRGVTGRMAAIIAAR